MFLRYLNQKGLIHFIPLLLLLAGIIGGVYLVQKSGYQIFKPKAAGASIQFIDNSQSSTSCVTTKDNKQVTTCPTIQFKLFSPLENQSYNTVPGLVSTAYAHDEGLDEQESRSCTTNGIGMHVVRSSKPGTGFVEFCWPGAQECRTYQFEDGHDWARCVRTTFPPCDGEIDWKRGRDICKPKAQPSAPQGPAPECSNDTACVDGNACTEDSCQNGKCVHRNSPAGKVCVVSSGDICDGNGKCVAAPPPPPPSPSPEPSPESSPTPGVVEPTPSAVGAPAGRPAACPEEKEEYPQCGGTVGLEDKDPTHTYMATRVKDCRGKVLRYEKTKDLGDLGQCRKPTPDVAPAGAPSIAKCTTDDAGSVTAQQAKCVLDLRTDILSFYQKNNWCIDEGNYPSIVNNWMKINNAADKDQVKNCFGGGTTTTRTTKRYRVAETPDKFQDRDYGWKTYTTGLIVEYTFEDKTPGVKYIYVQFEDDQGNIINNTPITAQIELVLVSVPGEPTLSARASCDGKTSIITWSWTIPSSGVDTFNVILPGNTSTNNPASSSFKEYVQRGATAGQTNTGRIEVVNSAGKNLAHANVTALDCSTGSPTPTSTPTPRPEGSVIPAGSACESYHTTSVCGGGFKTYDKCTDDKGQTGSSLCSGGAVQFYCEGSTNSNCISSTTRTPHYYCSACPNLSGR